MLSTLSPLELTYCLVVLLFTFALRGSIGFGGAVGLPLLALAIPVKILAPAWSLIGIVSSAAIVGHDRKHVARREFVAILPGCALGVAAGLFVFKALDAALLARCLGGFVVLYAAYSYWMSGRPAGTPPPMPASLLKPFASFFSGAVGTMFGAMASIFSRSTSTRAAPKHAFRATLSAMLTLSVVRALGYAAVGELTVDSSFSAAPRFQRWARPPPVGDRIHTDSSEKAYKRVVCAAADLAACCFS